MQLGFKFVNECLNRYLSLFLNISEKHTHTSQYILNLVKSNCLKKIQKKIRSFLLRYLMHGDRMLT